MTDHLLSCVPSNFHGAFAPGRAPILTVDPGDSVTVSVLDAGWHLLEQERPLTYDSMVQIPERPTEALGGH